MKFKSPSSNSPSSNSSDASSSNSSPHSSWRSSADVPAETSTRSRFIALEVSYLLIPALASIVPVIERNDRDLGDQIRRAATSTSLNLAEGQRSAKGNRQKHYALAHGSADEVRAGLNVAHAWGWIDDNTKALAILDRLLAIMWGLTHA